MVNLADTGDGLIKTEPTANVEHNVIANWADRDDNVIKTGQIPETVINSSGTAVHDIRAKQGINGSFVMRAGPVCFAILIIL